MKPPQTTLLILEPTRLTRADFGSSSTVPLRLLQQPRLGGTPFNESIRTALGLAPECGKNVWIAAEDIWSQQLTLPGAATAGLAQPELAAALAFEAEPLSGIPSTNAALGFVAVHPPRHDGLVDFAAIAIEASVRDEIQSVIKKAGGKLRGFCCVKDLPQAAKSKNENEWVERCVKDFQLSPPPFPLITPAPEKVSPLRYWIFGLALEAAVLLICFTHWKSATAKAAAADAALLDLRKPRKQFDELKTKNDAVKAELKKLQEDTAANTGVLDSAAREVVFQRAHIPAILRSLSKERLEDIAILGIKSNEKQLLTVEGLSIEPGHADTYATKLETALEPRGMRVIPLNKVAQNVAANGGPWMFTLQITENSTTAPPLAKAAPGIVPRRGQAAARKGGKQ